MFITQKKRFSLLLSLAGFFVLAGSFLISGCSTTLKAPATLDTAVSKPQVIVNPDSISLGVAALTGTKIVFEGSGFKPGDSVFITLIGANEIKEVVADGNIQADGKFTAPIGTLAKVVGILRGTISGESAKDGSYNQFIVITQPPIPAGVYTARATSMIADSTAETKLTIKEPSFGEKVKDWLGGMLGKIVDKRPTK
jgi:hypothetical protein